MAFLKHRTIYMSNSPPGGVTDDGLLPVRRVNVELLGVDDSDSESDSSGGGLSCGGGPRKRRRLTHLTPEEKMMRRKLKNRVAAQTARDRKKQRMSELEDALALIEAENKRLQAENDSLKQCTSQLSNENVLLKQRLCTPSNPLDAVTTDGVKVEPDCSSADVVCTERLGEPKLESAVLTVSPLQQDLARTVISLTTTQLMAICIFMISLTHWWMALKCSPRASSEKKLCSMTSSSQGRIISSHHRSILPRNPQVPPWWGSHQRSWNPSMN